MEYRVLGPLEVLDASGHKLSLGGTRQRSVLASLLLRAGQTVTLDRLVDELWEEPPATAVRTVQAYVSRLRHELSPGAIESRPGGYALVLRDDQLDLDGFERKVEEGHAALTTGEVERASSVLREALTLWRGPALAGLTSEPLRRQADRLEERRLTAFEDRVEADLAAGRSRELIGELETMVVEHPYRERLRTQLMLALYRSGRQAEALEAYQQARTALDDLGLDPSAALRWLQNAILRQDEMLQPSRELPWTSAGGYLLSSGESTTSRTPTLDLFGLDVTELARERKLDPVIGRATEVEKAIEILCRRIHHNPVLLGEPGVGKTAIVEEIARRIATGQVPQTLAAMRLVCLQFTAMATAIRSKGEFAERLTNAVREIARSGNVILFIDEVHRILGAGAAQAAPEPASVLKPALAHGEVQMITTTAPGAYREMLRHDAALERHFEAVLVPEPSAEDTIEILRGLKGLYEQFHGVRIFDEAIVAAVELADGHIDGLRPSKAVDLIDRASARVALRAATRDDQTSARPDQQLDRTVTPDDVAAVLAREVDVSIQRA